MAGAKWYIINAYSNFEKKVAAQIREQASNTVSYTHLTLPTILLV